MAAPPRTGSKKFVEGVNCPNRLSQLAETRHKTQLKLNGTKELKRFHPGDKNSPALPRTADSRGGRLLVVLFER